MCRNCRYDTIQHQLNELRILMDDPKDHWDKAYPFHEGPDYIITDHNHQVKQKLYMRCANRLIKKEIRKREQELYNQAKRSLFEHKSIDLTVPLPEYQLVAAMEEVPDEVIASVDPRNFPDVGFRDGRYYHPLPLPSTFPRQISFSRLETEWQTARLNLALRRLSESVREPVTEFVTGLNERSEE